MLLNIKAHILKMEKGNKQDRLKALLESMEFKVNLPLLTIIFY